jgi:hypothetical protein
MDNRRDLFDPGQPQIHRCQVFGRVRRGKRSTPDKWYWSEQPTHPAIIDRDTWGKAQKAGEDHRSSRDRAIHNPVNWRAYPFRSRVRCKTVQPQHPRPRRRRPGYPRTVAVREDLVKGEALLRIADCALAPGREERFRELIPSTATAKKDQDERRTAALEQRAKRIITSRHDLRREITSSGNHSPRWLSHHSSPKSPEAPPHTRLGRRAASRAGAPP